MDSLVFSFHRAKSAPELFHLAKTRDPGDGLQDGCPGLLCQVSGLASPTTCVHVRTSAVGGRALRPDSELPSPVNSGSLLHECLFPAQLSDVMRWKLARLCRGIYFPAIGKYYKSGLDILLCGWGYT